MIFIYGKERFQTSVTHDNTYLNNFCKRHELQTVRDIRNAETLISVWWNTTPIIPGKKYIIYISNFVTLENKALLNRIITMDSVNPKKITWICPSTKQKEEFKDVGLKTEFCPFHIHDCYYNKTETDDSIFNQKLLLYNGTLITADDARSILKEKLVAGSFQRDSLGSVLKKPKWQKGPENIISLIKDSKKKKDILLLLCGPRRHYIISECQKHGINYLYLCNKQLTGDDIGYNTFSQEETFALYNLIDFYICGSVLEGGPKCIIESAHVNIPIFSQDVGLASDYIPKSFLQNSFKSNDLDLFIEKIKDFHFIKNYPSLSFKDNKLLSIINEG